MLATVREVVDVVDFLEREIEISRWFSEMPLWVND